MPESILHAVVTLFFPKEKELENLSLLARDEAIQKLIVVQNSEGDLKLPDNPKLILVKNLNRGGLGGAFNRAAEYSFSHGATHLLILDQDSVLPERFGTRMLEFMREHRALIAAPDFFDINAKSRGSFGTFGKFSHRPAVTEGNFARSHYAISSGTLVAREAFEKIGPYDEDLIVNHIDTDYHERARLKGIDIFINRDVTINHSIGERTKHRLLGLVTIKPTNHGAMQRYYHSRNTVVMIKRYLFRSPAFTFVVFARYAHDLLGILLYENNKAVKLKAVLKGAFDGLFGRLGLVRP